MNILTSLARFFSSGLYDYNKYKVDILKAVLPFIVILGHLYQEGIMCLSIFVDLTIIAMFLFFAMSGYGLVISYITKKDYLNGFLSRSLLKLYLPYIFVFILFVIYRFFHGIDQKELLKTVGLMSFIPTSWYIYVLSFLYIAFYVCFKYIRFYDSNFVKYNTILKSVIVCLVIFAYCFIAPHIGISHWRYDKCPAFCVGVFFALFNNSFLRKGKRLHVILFLFCAFLLIPPHGMIKPFIYPFIVFNLLYIVEIKTVNRIIKFLSSISLEMFIIQFLPIYIVIQDIGVNNPKLSIPFVFILDIIMGYLLHLLVNKIFKKIRK